MGGVARWKIPELETDFDEVVFEVEGGVCCVAEETEKMRQILVANAIVCPGTCCL